MNKCCDKPDREARAQYYPQRQLFVKTYKSREEKQNTRHNAPQSTLGVLGHQVEITRIIQIKPDKHDKAGQRHHGNQPGQRRQPAPYLRAKSNNAHTDQQLDSKSHTNTTLVIPAKPVLSTVEGAEIHKNKITKNYVSYTVTDQLFT